MTDLSSFHLTDLSLDERRKCKTTRELVLKLGIARVEEYLEWERERIDRAETELELLRESLDRELKKRRRA